MAENGDSPLNVVQETEYYPFGLAIPRSGTDAANKYQFLDREKQPETGYIDLVKRFYDPNIGRFMQVDPVTETQENYSTYQYGWNNPILQSDPNGDCPSCPQGEEAALLYQQGAIVENQHGSWTWTGSEWQDNSSVAPATGNGENNSSTGEAIVIAVPLSQSLPSLSLPSLTGIGNAALNLLKAVATIPVMTAALVLKPTTLNAPAPVLNDSYTYYTPPPKSLPGFPGAAKVKPKGGRARWVTPDGKILEWDSQHGEVEVYDKSGRNHQGAADPQTGEMIKSPKPGRTTPK